MAIKKFKLAIKKFKIMIKEFKELLKVLQLIDMFESWQQQYMIRQPNMMIFLKPLIFKLSKT